MVLLTLSALPLAFMIASPALPKTYMFGASVAVPAFAPPALPPLPVAAPLQPMAPAESVLSSAESVLSSVWSAVCVFLFGITHSASAEDALLALVAPATHRLLVQWRRDVYGSEARIASALNAARQRLGLGSGATIPLLSVEARCKGLWSTFTKAAVVKRPVYDVLALRLVVPDGADVYASMANVRALWPIIPGRAKDYVRTPKPNGYAALHDTVRLPCGTPLEIQIRTQSMHARAERGSAAHRRYKGHAQQLSALMLAGMSTLALAPIHGGLAWPSLPPPALA